MIQTLTNQQMYEGFKVLSELDETGLLGFAIARNRRKLREELAEYIVLRDKLLKEYGTDQGDGTYSLTKEKAVEFLTALAPYENLITDVNVATVSPEVLYSGKLNSAQMEALLWMVTPEDN